MRRIHGGSRAGLARALAMVALTAATPGCQNDGSRRGGLAARSEPGLSGPRVVEEGGTVIASAPPARGETFADRHPALSEPRQVYEETNNNKVVKTARAAFIGVPVGIAREVKQIFVGVPPADAPR